MTSEIIPGVGGAAFVALDATDFNFSAFFLHGAFYNNMFVSFCLKRVVKFELEISKKRDLKESKIWFPTLYLDNF